jgi:predicted regulator of Ras-like GTPase activity (Roadblock/LC7/MglB family)
MSDNAFGGFFIGDAEDDVVPEGQSAISVPLVVPEPTPASAVLPPSSTVTPPPAPAAAPAWTAPVAPSTSPAPAEASTVPTPAAASRVTREQRLVRTLDRLMEENQEVEAAALVSLDGFTMASALPEGMQEDRVGAMSAAILGLGERAATELGRGHLSQVFIEGENGYVMLIAAGDRAVLTCLAGTQAKLGLVLYDMREAADEIAEILG